MTTTATIEQLDQQLQPLLPDEGLLHLIPWDKFTPTANSQQGIWINRFILPEEDRSQGIGSAVLTTLTEYCDNHNITLIVYPDATEPGVDGERLNAFYKNYGFTEQPYPGVKHSDDTVLVRDSATR